MREDDEDESDFESERLATTAGWTIFCNDRAVIVGDKSRLTGWGGRLPVYHGQFSVITGIVEFRAASADKLPITTTKRALDTSSDVWIQALVKMEEGLRIWVNHTNNWKNHPRSDQSKFWESTNPMPLTQVVSFMEKHQGVKKFKRGFEFNPVKAKVLPIPDTKTPTSRRIAFSRPNEEIKIVSQKFFDREDERPALVGDECFKFVLNSIETEKTN
jgi:hypothetical protein